MAQAKAKKTEKVKKTESASLEAKVFTSAGKEGGTVSLPENIFGLSWNADLVHQVVNSMLSNMRPTVAHVKDRSEVRGGGKKPWKQKGTGRARHGSRRSPIWVGGGVTHGPRAEKDYSKKINKKMKAKALAVILSKKFRDGELIFIDSIKVSEPKTKKAISVLASLGKIKGFEKLVSKKKNAALLALPEKDVNTEKSFRNIGNLSVTETRNINPVLLSQHKFIIVSNPDAFIGKFK